MIEVAFQGRLGKDASLDRVRGGELPRLMFSLCVTGKDEDPDAPRWLQCTVFGERAEQLDLEKGMQVYVEGRLSWSVWQPDDGRPARANLQVLCSNVVPLYQIGRRRPSQHPRCSQPQQRPQHQLDGDPPRAGYVHAWSLPIEATPFHDDTDAAVADLEGRRTSP